MRSARGLLLCASTLPILAAACAAAPGPVAAAAVGSLAPPGPEPGGAPAAGGQPVVVLDAGHNGGNAAHPAEIGRQVPDGRGGTKACNTTGTQTDVGYPEHAFTFDVTARAAQRLTEAGVRVVLVRTDDTGVGPCVDERGRAGEADGADAVVSIHADGAPSGDRGFHVALPHPPLNPAQGAASWALGTALRDAMRGAGFTDSDYLGAEGISLRADLAGLNLSTRPVALVECANMRSPEEAAVVSSPEGRQRYAEAIAAGIRTFLALPRS